MGLTPPVVNKKSSPKKILSEEELKAAQDLILMIRKEIMGRGYRPEQIVEKYKKSSTDVTMAPKEFNYALNAEFKNAPAINQKI